MIIIIAILIIAAVALIALGSVPLFVRRAEDWQDKQEKIVAKEMDKMFYDKSPRAIVRLYFILPPAFAAAAFIFLRSPILAAGAFFLGLVIPNLSLRVRYGNYRKKFNGQLLDTVQLLSSCLKGGLSLLQAFEVVTEEMPSPMKNEIGWVVRENKMGVTLEESLARLNKRMQIEELSLLTNAILVAKETGGELTKVFSRLSVTIRDNRKLKENIKTLTLQGRMQGIIMSILPFIFVGWVLTVNRNHFEVMLNNDKGRLMLMIAVGLQILGMYLIRKFSRIDV